ncbi:unnamed protein product, partial [Cyprideis torosa]
MNPAIAKRKEFSRLLDKMERGDVLIVTKLDRLGRDAIDVSQAVAKLEKSGIKVHCLALGGVDLTSSAGKMTMGVINAMAQFERDLLIERTQAVLTGTYAIQTVDQAIAGISNFAIHRLRIFLEFVRNAGTVVADHCCPGQSLLTANS